MSDYENNIEHLIEQLMLARNDAGVRLKETYSLLQSNTMLEAKEKEEISVLLSSVLQLQNDIFAVITPEYIKPATMSELFQITEAIQRNSQLKQRIEEARQSITSFIHLQCLDDEAAYEFVQHQAKAESILQQLSDEELVVAGEIYEKVIRLIRNPEETFDRPELYKQITKSIGYATRQALEQGWLIFPTGANEFISAGLEGCTDEEREEEIEEEKSGIINPKDFVEVTAGLKFTEIPSGLSADDIGNSTSEGLMLSTNLPINNSELSEVKIVSSFPQNEQETTNSKIADDFADIPRSLFNFSIVKYDCIEKKKNADNFSANKFEGDLKQASLMPRLAAFVMCYLYNNGVVADNQLELLMGDPVNSTDTSSSNPADIMRVTFRKLCQKGYLAEHTIMLMEQSDVFYTLSAYGAAAFRKESSRKLLQTRSQMRLIVKAEEDPLVLNADNVAVAPFRLQSINRAVQVLSKRMPKRLSMSHTIMLPFPHREFFDKQTGKNYLLIPGMLDASEPQVDLNRMIDTASMYNDFLPIVVVDSEDEGGYWVERLSSAERQAYFLFIENQDIIIGNSEGMNQLAVLFELEEEDVDNGVTDNSAVPTNEIHEEPHEMVQTSAMSQEELGSLGEVLALSTAKVNTSVIIEATHSQQEVQVQPQFELSASIKAEDLKLIVETALSRLAEGGYAEGMLLLHEAAEHSNEVEVLRDKVSFILNDPLCKNEDWHMLADMPINLPFGDFETLDDCLNAAMWLRIFFEPEDPNDYRLNNRWKQINSDLSSRVLEQFSGIKQLISYFWKFIDRHNISIKYCASSDVRDQLGVNLALEQVEKRIGETLTSIFPRNTMSEINHPKIKQMVMQLYGNSGLMTRHLQGAFEMQLDDLRVVCQLFTETDLSVDLGSLDLKPDDSKLEQFLDRHWVSMNNWSSNDKSTMLTGALRNRMRNWLREATEPLLTYYACRNAVDTKRGRSYISPETASKTRSKLQELMLEAMRQLDEQPIVLDSVGYRLLQSTINDFQSVFVDKSVDPKRYFYEPLLLSGEIELDADYLPIKDIQLLQTLQPVAGYSLWERLLRHCSLELRTWEEAASQALRNYDMGMYDLITKRDGEWPTESMVKETRKKAPQQLVKYNEDFRTEVELAQNYGQMASNDEMYGYIKLAEAAKKHAEKTLNVGFFKRMLNECRTQIEQGSDTRMEATRIRLEALKEDTLLNGDRDDQISDEDVLQQWPILDKIERALDKRNMTVAEDYIQLAASGQKDTPSIHVLDSDIHKSFLERYQLLFNGCNAHKGEDLYRTYDQSVRNLLFPNQKNRNTASAERFIKLWYKLQPQQISEFMEQLLFHKVEQVEKGRENEFYVFPSARDAQLGHYPHPFKEFGTEAVQKGIRVLALAGVRTADSMLDDVMKRGAGNGAGTIVVLDYALPLADRRLLAKSIKLRSIPEIIVVIDRVMALFLSGYSQIDRGNAFLMVALPFSKIQPYIPVGGIPPEMFIGRADELEKIRIMNGPVFVYGGRQLGKTALLRESRNREHDPDQGRFAIFVDLRDKDVDESLRSISEELMSENLLAQPCKTWDDLRTALRVKLTTKDRPVHKLMLLLDEADAFLEACESNQNRPLEVLKELKDTFNGQFKFVLAGLRDVVRFDKRRLGGNSVLAHLGHITIRPLQYLDARDLLLRPLQYLGFRIEANGEDIISLILAKTNYYPGLIHLYCQKLIEAITDSYRNGNYNENTNPPYLLDEKHIKTLLGQKELLSEIENKFRITLQLDTDNLYDILAKAIAYRYYEAGIGRSSSAQDIIRICREFNINKIAGLPEDSVKALLEEMDELNIIRCETRGSANYVFNRYSFFQMLGSSEDDLFYQLCELGEN